MSDDENEDEQFGKWDGPRDDASGAPHGFGTATYPSGDVYVGEMNQNQRHGTGKYTFKNGGTVYEGGYSANKKQGAGKVSYADGSTYEGEWDQGLRSGEGTCQYANGDNYQGQWADGKKSGKGQYHSKSGNCWFVGKWENGAFVDGEWKFEGGSYQGPFKNGRPWVGEGTFYFSNGNKQSGCWIQLPKGEDDEEDAPPRLQWCVS